MKIQNINILPQSTGKSAAKPVLKIGDALKPKTEPTADDVKFKKQQASVMRKALVLSLVMLSGTVAYFRHLAKP